MRDLIDIVLEDERLDELSKYKQGDEVTAFLDLMNNSPNNSIGLNNSLIKEFIKYLKSKGYTALGSGCFGVTFTHPSLNYVLKMFISDPAYLAFVRFCLANQSNPHLPKFRGKFMKLNENCFVVRMERLSPIVSGVDLRIADMISLYQQAYAGKQMAFCAMIMTKFSDMPAMLEAFGVDRFIGCDDPSAVGGNGLLDTVDKLISVIPSGVIFDMHGANFMKRGETIVFTDPFFHRDR